MEESQRIATCLLPVIPQWVAKCFRMWTLEQDCLCSNTGFATDWLCDLGKVTEPLCAPISSSLKWG